jgi:hypothetical protein
MKHMVQTPAVFILWQLTLFTVWSGQNEYSKDYTQNVSSLSSYPHTPAFAIPSTQICSEKFYILLHQKSYVFNI